MGEKRPTLIVFGGLPGTGKTTLGRAVAEEHAATYLRIDTIGQEATWVRRVILVA